MDFLKDNKVACVVVCSIIIVLLICIIIRIAWVNEGVYPGGLSDDAKELLKYKMMQDPPMTERMTHYNPALFEGMAYKPADFEGMAYKPADFEGMAYKPADFEGYTLYPNTEGMTDPSEDKREHPKLADLLY